MSELEGYLMNIAPELNSVIRLFDLPVTGETPEDRFRMEAEEKNGKYRIRFSGSGESAMGEAEIPPEEDEELTRLHRKRAARRLCKQTLYDLCRKTTGIHPPWGSLTGVRPTRLMWEALEEGLTPEEGERRLIEKYDVSPEKARLMAEVTAVQGRMLPPGDQWMDVYIGIPFCTTRCAYCSFSSGEIGDGSLTAPYMEALKREMRAGAEILAESGKKLRALYVGGGTPTALPESALEELLNEINARFPGGREYTVEAGRPDTLNREKLRLIREAGTNRISINPQTMNDRTLEIIGRGHTAAQIWEAYALAREAGLGHINMDVIAGLPGENEKDFEKTLAAARELRPESLTVHTLALKRTSRLSLENAPLPPGDMTARMTAMGREAAREMGMEPYYLYKQKYMAGNQENTGYALPGHGCLYNVDMMEETTHILALGAGGISKRIYPGEGKIGRAPNVSNIETYIARVEEMILRKRELFLGETAPRQRPTARTGGTGPVFPAESVD